MGPWGEGGGGTREALQHSLRHAELLQFLCATSIGGGSYIGRTGQGLSHET